MKRNPTRLATCALVALGTVAALPAQEQPRPAQPQFEQPRQQAPATEARPARQNVVAQVNGDAITETELRASLEPQLRGREVDPEMVDMLREQVLQGLIESRLVEQYVIEEGPAIPEDEVGAVIDQLEQQVQTQGIRFEDFLEARGHTQKTLEKRIHGSLAWRKLQEQELTPPKLEQFFEQNKEQFPAETFDQARQEVAQAYTAALWQDIVRQMKPEAEIKVVKPEAPAPEQRPGNAFPPGGFPQQP